MEGNGENKDLREIQGILISLKESLLVLESALKMIPSKEELDLNKSDIFISIPSNIMKLKDYLKETVGLINMYLPITYQRLYALFMLNDEESKNNLCKFDLEDVTICLEDILKTLEIIEKYIGSKNMELDIPKFVDYDYKESYNVDSYLNNAYKSEKSTVINNYLQRFKVLTEMISSINSISKEDLKLYYQLKEEIKNLDNNPISVAKIQFHFMNLERKLKLNKSNRYKYLLEKEKRNKI